MTLATRAALAADGDLLDEDERTSIDRLLVDLARTAGGENHVAIDAAVEALAKGTEGFAAARMNRGIRAALTGRKVEDI
jgi:molecular chaperone HscA